jgi:plasmid stabilization system protein ParE
VARRLLLRPQARQDLNRIYDFIADYAGASSAGSITAKIEAHCRKLLAWPHRGSPHPELREGLRMIPCGKAVIAYLVHGQVIDIVRIRYGGQMLRPEDVAD